MARPCIVCYLPVLHQGYIDFFNIYPNADIAVLDNDVLRKRFDYVRKDIRALEPSVAVSLLKALSRDAKLVHESELSQLFHGSALILPDDDISNSLVEEFNAPHATLVPVFLRWDRKAIDSHTEVQPDRIISLSATDERVQALYREASRSTNWWRNVGAALVRGGKIIAIAHNGSVPTDYSSVIDGDPRITAKQATAIDTSIDIHAEPRIIGEAAAKGEKLADTSIYVSTFPCPTCAKLIAASGIKQCYFVEGYATIDGQSILKAEGVEIIKVETNVPRAHSRQNDKPYPAS